MLFFIFWPLFEKLLDCPKKYFARVWGLQPPTPSSYVYDLRQFVFLLIFGPLTLWTCEPSPKILRLFVAEFELQHFPLDTVENADVTTTYAPNHVTCEPNSYHTWRLTSSILPPSLKILNLVLHALWVLMFSVSYHWTRSSAIAEGPRDASCQLKSCQLPRNSAKTTYTTSPDQIDGMKLEI